MMMPSVFIHLDQDCQLRSDSLIADAGLIVVIMLLFPLISFPTVAAVRTFVCGTARRFATGSTHTASQSVCNSNRRRLSLSTRRAVTSPLCLELPVPNRPGINANGRTQRRAFSRVRRCDGFLP